LTTFLRSVKFGATAVLVAVLALVARGGAQQTIVPDAYLCPMHPDVVSRSAGSCPRCGMALALADPYDAREFLVAIDATPAAPRAGGRTRLRLTVREPSTRAVVRDFVEVHEKPYHLFVISQDLEHYDHVHPQQQRDGSYVVDVTLPKPGYYKVYSDFLPLGATPQVVPSVLVTADATSDLASAQARLVPDTTLSRTAGGMRVTLTLPSDGLVAGRDEKLQYHIVDAASGAPITDIEPYLAAFGHTLVLSEDTLHYVHAHPVEILPERGVRAAGGPDLTFKALMPKPGRYRVWTQLKRRGVVSTVSFTVAVASPAVAGR
jgi:hypothetical protein